MSQLFSSHRASGAIRSGSVAVLIASVALSCSHASSNAETSGESCGAKACSVRTICIDEHCVAQSAPFSLHLAITGSEVRGGELTLSYDATSIGVRTSPHITARAIAEALGGRGTLKIAFASSVNLEDEGRRLELQYFRLTSSAQQLPFKLVSLKLFDRSGKVLPDASVSISQEQP